MNRLLLAASLVVIGLGAVVLTSMADPATDTALAQDDGPRADATSGPDAQRPGLLEDPGQPRFDTRYWQTDFTISAVPFSEITPVLPPDAIPAIDAPTFESIDAARSWLADDSPVIALEIDGDARAYPLAILTWHEIVNDVVGDTPVAVTFCPLCHTALVYERELGGERFDFGVSGNLRYSDLIMFDRQTETWWQQATGGAIVGELTGAKLPFLPSQLIGLGQFAQAYPDGIVLTRETGFSRSYGTNPYAGYDSTDRQPFLFEGVTDGRMGPTERVVTLGDQDGDSISFPYSELRRTGVAQVEFEGEPVVVFWAPGARSALDRSVIDDSEDVGSTGVFSSTVDGETLTFSRGADEAAPIIDLETGSTWDITGRAIEGELVGTQLVPVPHGDHFWFAWAAFVPETAIWTTEGLTSIGGEVQA